MAAPNLDIERAADVLFDAAFMSDREAAEKHDLSRNTVLNYRRRLDPKHESYTPELVQLLALRVERVKTDTDWEAQLPETLRAALAAMRECFTTLDKRSPQALEQIAAAFTAMVDAALTLKMLDARLTPDKDREKAASDRQVFTAPHGQA